MTTLFSLPFDLIVSSAFVIYGEQVKAVNWALGGKRVWRANPKGRGICTYLRCCRNCLRNKAGRRCCSGLLVSPWVIAALHIVVSSVAIVLLTSADKSATGATKQVSCNCRISHGQSGPFEWLRVVLIQVGFWLFLSRPASITIGSLLVHYFHKHRTRRTNNVREGEAAVEGSGVAGDGTVEMASMQSDTPGAATTTTSTRVVNPLRSTISRRRTADRMSVDMDDISNASNSMTGESARSVAPRSDGGDGGEDSGEDGEGNRDNCTRRHTDESKWHTHEDEESGKTYYEHRLSGKVVWDIPGVNTDADAGSSQCGRG